MSSPTVAGGTVWKRVRQQKILLLMLLPVVAYYVVFSYFPLYGITLAFRDYSVRDGIMGSPWVGSMHFHDFVNSFYFGRLLKNTVVLTSLTLMFGFPLPILFAVALNEAKPNLFRKAVQTVSYFPNFISTVIIVSMLVTFTNPSGGWLMKIAQATGYGGKNMMTDLGMFRALYVGSSVWQNFGWNSIVYLAAMSAVDPGIYEAAIIDGASRLQRAVHVTIPCIKPTIVIVLLMSLGGLFSLGAEKIMLMYNPSMYEVSDVFSTYVYRSGIREVQFSFATAVNVFNSALNFTVLILANWLCRRFTETSLW